MKNKINLHNIVKITYVVELKEIIVLCPVFHPKMTPPCPPRPSGAATRPGAIPVARIPDGSGSADARAIMAMKTKRRMSFYMLSCRC